jgi:hypothetical protein
MSNTDCSRIAKHKFRERQTGKDDYTIVFGQTRQWPLHAQML